MGGTEGLLESSVGCCLAGRAGLGRVRHVLVLNGAVYVAEVPWFREHRTFLTGDTVAVPMPQNRSVDIDTPEDLKIAEMIRERI